MNTSTDNDVSEGVSEENWEWQNIVLSVWMSPNRISNLKKYFFV